MEPPYRRIAAEIRDRIVGGELRPGDQAPSARQITREYGVAIATATRVLAALRDEGLVHPVAGVGTVVSGQSGVGGQSASPATRPRGPLRTEAELSRERIVRAAISVADSDGLDGLSMRRVATELGVATMSLYRHVPNKDALLLAMADTVFGEYPLPAQPPAGWRAQYELIAHHHWEMAREHPWTTAAVSLTRPMFAPNGMAFTEWAMRVGVEAGLDLPTALQVYLIVATFVTSLAGQHATEQAAQDETGVTDDEWMAARDDEFRAITSARPMPLLAGVAEQRDFDLNLDSVFALGLRLLLDGIARLVD
jgi:AcrR family transcriptional regulator